MVVVAAAIAGAVPTEPPPPLCPRPLLAPRLEVRWRCGVSPPPPPPPPMETTAPPPLLLASELRW